MIEQDHIATKDEATALQIVGDIESEKYSSSRENFEQVASHKVV